MIGADLRLVPAKPYRDPGHYVHVSRRLAEETGAVWANQFDNLANREGHRDHDRPRDLAPDRRARGRLHLRLRHRRHARRRRHGAEAAQPGRAHRARRPRGQRALWLGQVATTSPITGSSITEGIGQSRVPGNLEGAPIDDAVRIPDAEALEQSSRC